MPNINFPSSPITGQPYTFNGSTWIYNGKAWVLNGTSGPQGEQGPQGDQGPQGEQGPSFIIPAIDTWHTNYSQNISVGSPPQIVDFNTIQPQNSNYELSNKYQLEYSIGGVYTNNGRYVLFLQVSGYVVWSSFSGSFINQVVRGVKSIDNVLALSSQVSMNYNSEPNYSLIPFSFNIILDPGEYFYIDVATENSSNTINAEGDSKLTIQLVNCILK
jgi:hypothetical protein